MHVYFFFFHRSSIAWLRFFLDIGSWLRRHVVSYLEIKIQIMVLFYFWLCDVTGMISPIGTEISTLVILKIPSRKVVCMMETSVSFTTCLSGRWERLGKFCFSVMMLGWYEWMSEWLGVARLVRCCNSDSGFPMLFIYYLVMLYRFVCLFVLSVLGTFYVNRFRPSPGTWFRPSLA